MASLRDLKKDIDFVCSEVVMDCLIYVQVSENPDLDAAQEILNEALVLNGEMRVQANHPDGKDNPKLVKAYYNALVNEFLDKTNALYERLNALA